MVGDTGTDLRTTLKVLSTIGVPDEKFWPYETEKFNEEPSSFLYSLAKPIPNMRYFRLDEDESGIWDVLTSFLAAGFPAVLGFAVPSSLTKNDRVNYWSDFDTIIGGQAVVAIGYKNHLFGPGQHGILIRSSWGKRWGDNGDGWLPVSFLSKRLASNFWALIAERWIDSTELSRPSVLAQSETAD